MLRFRKMFNAKCNVIGMIHIGALPGTPYYKGSLAALAEIACKEAEIYKRCQVDGVLIENMHDIPYVRSKDMEPETVAVLSTICLQVRNILPTNICCGIQILAGGNKEALAVAIAAGLQFIRAEGFVFTHIADEGIIDASAGNLLRYRRKIGAEDVLIFADVKKKHSAHAITSDVSLEETIKAAEFFQSDATIVTGSATGDPVDVKHLEVAKKYAEGPVLIGSGITKQNITKYIASDGVIVGSHFKRNGRWHNGVDEVRVQKFMDALNNMKHCT